MNLLFLSFLLVILGIIKPTSNAEDLQKLCQGQRYGTMVPNPDDCNSFYVCQFVIQKTYCSNGLHFDRRKQVCNWPKDADCGWVDNEVIVPKPEPEKPNSNEDKYPEVPAETPSNPIPDGENNGDLENPNQGGDLRPSEESNEKKSSEESGELQPGSGITGNDLVTDEPHNPAYTDSSEENHNGQENFTATDDDLITDESQTQNPTVDDMFTEFEESEELQPDNDSTDNGFFTKDPQNTPLVDSSEENPDSQENLPATDDDFLSNATQTQGPVVDDIITASNTPCVASEESFDSTPALPTPNQPHKPPILEGTDQNPSDETQSPLEAPNIRESTDNPNLPNSDNNHWNLIASIVSVESSNKDGFVNYPTVGAHNPQTGYPMDAMSGYDPINVKCIHSGLYFLPHPNNCQKYYICAYHHLHLHSCGNGVTWNHKNQQCDLNGKSKCYSRNAESKDNTEVVTPFIDYQTKMTTKKNKKNSTRRPKLHTTSSPVATTISQKPPICPAVRQVYLPNLDDCNKYYICVMGKPVLTSCPSGMHWDANGEFCGKPSSVRCARRRLKK